ncbi:hemolysin family protein [Cognatishimia sp. F0-27]|uniref:hemolysin family protein n=1 Tax=Cognatishimia sp. F0-27 TaxID=2816855 RepID=UPI001D0C9C47|nr:hemolysin family protein [Cognatishimia sp. F0-27]MCC1494359.1 HlyC/CorC family transporter [Cognatishimia sp. F0-27]
MGDTDGSSKAAQSARIEEHNDHATPHRSDEDMQHHRPGFFRRVFGWPKADMVGYEADTPRTATDTVAHTHGMINLRRLRVEDVAIPKIEIIAVPVTITKNDLVQVFRDSGLTRLPVYEGTLDTPIGMVHLKDLALLHGFDGTSTRFNLKRMLRPLVYVPPSMPIGVLLTKMQTERRHMALVIDEYGGVDGLVTIEDLIEQVIGEIEDEHDTDEAQNWTREKSGCYLVQAKTPLDEFESEIGLALTDHDDIDEEEIDTLGGLVFMLAGHVPARGEVVPHPEGVDFEVVDADPRRIKRLRVRLPGSLSGAVTKPAPQPRPTEATPQAEHG